MQCKELTRLNERLDQLDARQQRQLTELRDAVDLAAAARPTRSAHDLQPQLLATDHAPAAHPSRLHQRTAILMFALYIG